MSFQRVGKNILELLVLKKLLDGDRAKILSGKLKDNASASDYLLKKNLISEEDLVKASAELLNIPFVRIQGRQLEPETLQTIPYDFCQRFNIVAFEKKGNVVQAAVAKPYFLKVGIRQGPLHTIEQEKGIVVEISATPKSDFEWALLYYKNRLSDESLPAVPSAIKTSELPSIALSAKNIDPKAIAKFPKDIIAKYQIAVFSAEKGLFKVGVVDPYDSRVDQILKFIEDKNQIKVEKYHITKDDLDYIIENWGKDKMGERVSQSTAGAPSPISVKDELRFSSPPVDTFKDEKVLSSEIKNVGGIYFFGDNAVAAPQIGRGENLRESTDLKDLAGADETDLDVFLGKQLSSKEEMIGIIQTGYMPKIVAGLFSLGVKFRASDIHIEPSKTRFRIRYRIDGQMHEFFYLPITLHPPMISRIKILSGLKIDEQRIPQDGRLNVKAQNHEIDVRVSSFPTVHGEKIVMRLLDKTTGKLTLEQLGIGGESLKRLRAEIDKPWGVIIATGPTGSGKTTTLYSIINSVSKPNINIITLEDPVEYDIEGINQAQVKPKIGFSFAEGLRSVLRQDPNVIMVGEIRDSETANLVTHAALTGHLVLTTLHTNDASSALPRLTNMKVEPFLITSSINAITAQRLVRKLCPQCRKEANIPSEVRQEINAELKKIDNPQFFIAGKGCDQCFGGYLGRVGLYEVLTMSDKIEQAALQNQPASHIMKIAQDEGMITIRQDGILKSAQGLISLEEALKATND